MRRPGETEVAMAEPLKDRADSIIKLARLRKMTLATVESCTAGSFANLLSQPEGASNVLHGGFVVYTKENKVAAVGVPADLLAAHTAVSGEVAGAMAEGGLARSPADMVVAITGVAGPEPDEDGNPVGLVFVAAICRGGRRRIVRYDFGENSKEEICSAAMDAGLDLIRQLLAAQVP
jgi:nicotinamide-nucleotide amidase